MERLAKPLPFARLSRQGWKPPAKRGAETQRGSVQDSPTAQGAGMPTISIMLFRCRRLLV